MSGSLWEKELPLNTQTLYKEIKRLRNKGFTYDDITKYLNKKGWTTSQGKEFYGSYIHNIERRLELRHKKLERYKRTIEDLRVEFHYDEDKENQRTTYDYVIKGTENSK